MQCMLYTFKQEKSKQAVERWSGGGELFAGCLLIRQIDNFATSKNSQLRVTCRIANIINHKDIWCSTWAFALPSLPDSAYIPFFLYGGIMSRKDVLTL
jgi:hypothetical protein